MIQAELVNGRKAYSLFPLAFEWTRLREAIAANAEFLQWRRGFQIPLQEGDAYGRYSYSALLRGDALDTAQRYVAERPEEFTEREVGFIRRSAEQASAVSPTAVNRKALVQWTIGTLAGVVALLIAFLQFESGRVR